MTFLEIIKEQIKGLSEADQKELLAEAEEIDKLEDDVEQEKKVRVVEKAVVEKGKVVRG